MGHPRPGDPRCSHGLVFGLGGAELVGEAAYGAGCYQEYQQNRCHVGHLRGTSICRYSGMMRWRRAGSSPSHFTFCAVLSSAAEWAVPHSRARVGIPGLDAAGCGGLAGSGMRLVRQEDGPPGCSL
jgi:hypothetical protein